MNLTITKEQITNGLQAVQNVVSTRTTLPILSNVLMRAEGDKLEFTATDLDVTISCGVEAKVKKPGASTVPDRARRRAGLPARNRADGLRACGRLRERTPGRRRFHDSACRGDVQGLADAAAG